MIEWYYKGLLRTPQAKKMPIFSTGGIFCPSPPVNPPVAEKFIFALPQKKIPPVKKSTPLGDLPPPGGMQAGSRKLGGLVFGGRHKVTPEREGF